MNSLSKILTTGSYALGCAVVAALLPSVLGFSGSEATGAGAILFLFFALAHMHIDAARDSRAVQRRLTDLAAGQQALRIDLDHAMRDTSRLNDTIDALDVKSNREIVNEMRVLEGLLHRLAEKRSSPDGRQPPAPGATPHAALLAQQAGMRGAANKPQITLAALNEALEENRIDLYLQPIVSLPQRKLRFYEGYSRLRNLDGTLIEPGQYLGVAEEAGIVSTIDNLLLLRCVQLIRRLHHRNRSVVIFCNISAHSLRDQGFFPQFVDFMEQNNDLAGSMIFEFSQATVEENTPLEWRQLARLAKQGYRFSMDNLSHLDISLEELSSRRFGYIKVPASTLLNGMQQARSRFLSTDIKQAMRRFGIDLIAEKIEEEGTVVGLLEFELDFGQGYLFGEPRRSRGPDELQGAPRPGGANQLQGAPLSVAK